MRSTACWTACGDGKSKKDGQGPDEIPEPWPCCQENFSLSRAICLAYRSSSEKTQPQYFCM